MKNVVNVFCPFFALSVIRNVLSNSNSLTILFLNTVSFSILLVSFIRPFFNFLSNERNHYVSVPAHAATKGPSPILSSTWPASPPPGDVRTTRPAAALSSVHSVVRGNAVEPIWPQNTKYIKAFDGFRGIAVLLA